MNISNFMYRLNIDYYISRLIDKTRKIVLSASEFYNRCS